MIRIQNLACASHEIMDGWLFSSYYAKIHRLRQGWAHFTCWHMHGRDFVAMGEP